METMLYHVDRYPNQQNKVSVPSHAVYPNIWNPANYLQPEILFDVGDNHRLFVQNITSIIERRTLFPKRLADRIFTFPYSKQ